MDASAFPGAFGTMVADCNALVDAHIQVKMRAISIMGRYAVGDLSQDMERLPGEKAVITEALDRPSQSRHDQWRDPPPGRSRRR
jgi:methyl-accepting chemotaxis protein-1 (serine sensor receptor)